MSDLVRTDTIFGKRANIVGNISADLVLESLGKVYIKSRNSAKTLEEIITSLALGDINTTTSRVEILNGVESLDPSSLKDGLLVFDKLSNILYILLDNDLIELINVSPEGTGYVKRSGDTMSGRLTINVLDGPPLYVNSTELVKNLNANYLLGESADAFTRRTKNENITGQWKFKNQTEFEGITKFDSNALFNKDIITTGSIGTPSFASGFGGYGWRMDGTTNTLTIDNLVVRRLMQVYELVVNKISATNGSLWVTNAGKVVKCYKLIENPDFSTKNGPGLTNGDYFIYNPCGSNYNISVDIYDNACTRRTLTCISSVGRKQMKLVKLNTDSFNLNINSGFQINNYYDIEEDTLDDLLQNTLLYQSLYDSNFRFNVLFPIVPITLSLDSVITYNDISYIKLYYQYFELGDFYIVEFDDDSLPVFKPGDILRCQKWTYGGIKSYDAVVCKILSKPYKSDLVVKDNCTYIILVNTKVYNTKTTINYDDALNPNILFSEEKDYTLSNTSDKGQLNGDILLGIVEEKDSLVQIGNLWNALRLNAVYITSVDDGAPFIDVLTNINRPDYTVIYKVPKYKVEKFYATNILPYTGNYYIWNKPSGITSEQFLDKDIGPEYKKDIQTGVFSKVILYPSNWSAFKFYRTTPNLYTELESPSTKLSLLKENGNYLLDEQNNKLLLEEETTNIIVSTTRTTRVRVGNLDGIYDEQFPEDKLPYGYGLYGQNVFLTGEFYLNNGKAVADIGAEAIAFAVAGDNVLNSRIDYIKQATNYAINLLRNDVYTKGDLESAGMFINDLGIVLWGDRIFIVTSKEEFEGGAAPTALFNDGKIRAKYLSIDEVHSSRIYLAPRTKVSIGGTNYTTYDSNGNNYTILKYKTEDDHIFYFRKYFVEGTDNYTLIYVTPDGYPEKENGQYVLGLPIVNGLLLSECTQELKEEFESKLEELLLWNLEVDGKGNFGGSSMYFDETGLVTVNGKLFSTEGLIAGFGLSEKALYVEPPIENGYEPLVFNTGEYGYDVTDSNSTISAKYIAYRSIPVLLLTSLFVNDEGKAVPDNRLTETPAGIFRQISDGNSTIYALVPEVLFSLTVLPVNLGDKWTLFARLSTPNKMFSEILMRYTTGKYAFTFTLMSTDDIRLIAERINNGNIHFQISGIGNLYDNTATIYDNQIINSDVGTKDLDVFTPAKINLRTSGPTMGVSSSGNYKGLYRERKINATIEVLAFGSSNKRDLMINDNFSFNSYFLKKFDSQIAYNNIAQIVATRDRTYLGKYNTGGLVKSENNSEALQFYGNAILISTILGNEFAWGGFNLTALYYSAYDVEAFSNIKGNTVKYENIDKTPLLRDLYTIYLNTLSTEEGENNLYVLLSRATSDPDIINDITKRIENLNSYTDNLLGLLELLPYKQLEIIRDNASLKYDAILELISSIPSPNRLEVIQYITNLWKIYYELLNKYNTKVNNMNDSDYNSLLSIIDSIRVNLDILRLKIEEAQDSGASSLEELSSLVQDIDSLASFIRTQIDSLISNEIELKDLTNKEFGYLVSSILITDLELRLPIMQNIYDLPYSIVSSDTSIAEINGNEILLTGTNGDTFIKATFEGNNKYNPKEITYLLIVAIDNNDGQEVELYYSESEVTATSKGLELPTLTKNPSDLRITYSSSNENVASINHRNGIVRILKNGTTIISATFVGNDTYKPKTTSYTLTVDLEELQQDFDYASDDGSIQLYTIGGYSIFRYYGADGYINLYNVDGYFVYEENDGYVILYNIEGGFNYENEDGEVQLYNLDE